MAITFYGRATSDNVQKARWMLEETSQPYEHVELGGRFGGLDDPAFLKLNPHGKVPLLLDGETVVWESNAIVRYLAATYSAGAMWPQDPAKRAYADQWMEWAQTRLYPDANRLFWLSVRTPEADHDLSKISATLERLKGYYEILERQLEGQDYVAGNQLTIADIPTGATLYRYFEMDLDRPDLPNICAWYDRLCARPAYQSAVMIPFDELRGRLAF